MSLYLSASTAASSQIVAQSNDFTVHALRRDKDGMLYYTVARSTEDAVFDFHRTDVRNIQISSKALNTLMLLLVPQESIQTM